MKYEFSVSDFDEFDLSNENTKKKIITAKKKIEFSDSKSHYCKIIFKGKTENAGGYLTINKNYDITINSITYMPITVPITMEIELVISAESSITLEELVFEEIEEKEAVEEDENDVLVIVPSYPSYVNLYYCAFAHARNLEYKKNGINFKVASISPNNWYESYYEIEQIPVVQGNYETLKKLLALRKYKVLVTHFVDEYLFSVFDGYAYPTDRIILICHGPETVYRYLVNVTRPYFTKSIPEKKFSDTFELKDKFIRKYSQMDNVEWVFVSQWLREFSEKEQKIHFKHSRVINNLINEEKFPYEEKTSEQRKKILVIRKFDNICQHSIDQIAMAILELSERKFFNDLEFEIYGDGDYYDVLVKPILGFENIHYHRTFIPNDQISEIHRNSGILLIPSRHDAHAVAMGEGASSGLVVVGSNVTSNPYFMQQDKFHTLANPEDPKELADIIERLYYNPQEFLDISRRLSKFTRENFGIENTVVKEIDLIRQKLVEANNSSFSIVESAIESPVLSIVVPAYNVENYLEKCIVSLVNHRNSHKTEVIIVNDGSTDNTLQIAQKLEKQAKGIVKIVDKENGGHGSTINVGIQMAKGRYFRLVDGDDWVDGEQLASLIDLLEHEEADIVLNKGSYEYVEKGLFENIIDYDMMNEGQLYKFDNLVYEGYGFKTYGPLLTTTNIKTEVLKRADFKLSEKMPYVDMEFNSFSLKYVNTIKYYDLDIYRYLIGRAGQTVSPEAWKKKYRDHATIIFHILSVINDDKDFSQMKKKYIYEHIITQMVDSQIFMYDIALAWNEIDDFLLKLQQYATAYAVSMEYIEKKQGNCQLILRKYKNYSGTKPIIIPGVYETIFDDDHIGTNLNDMKGIKYYVKKMLKSILPYGIVRMIVQKR